MQKKITAHNYAHKGFCFTQPSMTVPNQVNSIGKVLERFQRGQGVQSFPGVYNPEFPPDFDKLDKIGKIEAAREMQKKASRMRSILQQREADEKAAKQAAKEAEAAAQKSASDAVGQ